MACNCAWPFDLRLQESRRGAKADGDAAQHQELGTSQDADRHLCRFSLCMDKKCRFRRQYFIAAIHLVTTYIKSVLHFQDRFQLILLLYLYLLCEQNYALFDLGLGVTFCHVHCSIAAIGAASLIAAGGSGFCCGPSGYA